MKDDVKKYTVYAIQLDGIPNKTYFGMTSNLERRINDHFYGMKRADTEYQKICDMSEKERALYFQKYGNYTERTYSLYRDYATHGRKKTDVKVFIIAEELTKSEADEMETRLIEKYKTYLPERGYNNHRKDKLEKSYKVIRGMPNIELERM